MHKPIDQFQQLKIRTNYNKNKITRNKSNIHKSTLPAPYRSFLLKVSEMLSKTSSKINSFVSRHSN
jgi:hypothetical protein